MTARGLYDIIEQIVDHVVRAKIDYSRPWVGTVTSQVGNTIDVKPDNARLPNLLGIPIRTGVPDVTAKVKSGARARVHFDDGDPSKPFVALWDIESVESISIGGESGTLAPVARQGDAVLVTVDAGAIVKAASGTIQFPGVIVSGSSVVKAS